MDDDQHYATDQQFVAAYLLVANGWDAEDIPVTTTAGYNGGTKVWFLFPDPETQESHLAHYSYDPRSGRAKGDASDSLAAFTNAFKEAGDVIHRIKRQSITPNQ